MNWLPDKTVEFVVELLLYGFEHVTYLTQVYVGKKKPISIKLPTYVHFVH